jgi:hypothetical protein
LRKAFTADYFMRSYSPAPYKKVIKERKGIEGAFMGGSVRIPKLPSLFSYDTSDSVRSVVNRREPYESADKPQPINMYVFLR